MKNILIIKLMMIVTISFGQDSLLHSKMEALNKMVGIWEGNGWFMNEERTRIAFTQKEIISSELGGSALLIMGQGFAMDKMVHDAMAIVRFDPLLKEYSMFSLLADGKSIQANLEINELGDIVWGFKVPGGEIQYEIRIDDADTWKEKGMFSPDGEHWYPFIEFTLAKVN